MPQKQRKRNVYVIDLQTYVKKKARKFKRQTLK